MRHFIFQLVICLLISTSNADVRAQAASIDMNSHVENYFPTQVTLAGEYEFLEDGDLCFFADARSSKRIANTNGRVRVCFSNHEQALQSFNLQDAIHVVDLIEICGLKGRGTVQVTDIISEEGSSRRWYAARLKAIVKSTRYKLIKCHK